MMSEEDGEENKVKSKKPKDTQFHQQRLPAWQPILTAGTVAPFFFVIGIAFIPIGAVLLVTSNSIAEYSIDYTHCSSKLNASVECADEIRQDTNMLNQIPCYCDWNLSIDSDMQGEVLAYYALTNFYQNHRQYVKSRDDKQLNGQAVTDLNSDCDPYKTGKNGTTDVNYAPCGLIANSLFNDTFKLFYLGEDGSSSIEVIMTSKGIAWPTDVKTKFGKPAASSWANTLKPVNWKVSAYERNNGSYADDEPLLVWMRTAALPNFRKPYARIVQSGNFTQGLPKGKYLINITYAYPVTQFEGTKRFILSTKSWLGGKNTSLGILYIVVGGIMLFLAIGFIILHQYVTNRTSSHWSNQDTIVRFIRT